MESLRREQPVLITEERIGEGMRGGGRLWIVGSDSIKAQLFGKLQRGNTIRFSARSPPFFYEQLASERAVTRAERARRAA